MPAPSRPAPEPTSPRRQLFDEVERAARGRARGADRWPAAEDHQLGQGAVPADRLHEGRPDRLLRARSRRRCCRTCATAPLTLKRYPNGVDAPYFYEKQSPSHRPEWVRDGAHRRRRLHAGAGPPDAGLAGEPRRHRAAHVAVAGAERPSEPTMLVFDLDPGAPAGHRRVLRGRARAARAVRAARAARASPRPRARRGCRCTCRSTPPVDLPRRPSRSRGASPSCSSSGCPSWSSRG